MCVHLGSFPSFLFSLSVFFLFFIFSMDFLSFFTTCSSLRLRSKISIRFLLSLFAWSIPPSAIISSLPSCFKQEQIAFLLKRIYIFYILDINYFSFILTEYFFFSIFIFLYFFSYICNLLGEAFPCPPSYLNHKPLASSLVSISLLFNFFSFFLTTI